MFLPSKTRWKKRARKGNKIPQTKQLPHFLPRSLSAVHPLASKIAIYLPKKPYLISGTCGSQLCSGCEEIKFPVLREVGYSSASLLPDFMQM